MQSRFAKVWRWNRTYVRSHTADTATTHPKQTSDEIGKGVPGAAPRTAVVSSATATIEQAIAIAAAPGAPKVDPAAYLRGYKHQPKAEHPLYTTR